MQRNDLESITAARAELAKHGLVPLHSKPGDPEVWVTRGKPEFHYAIGRSVRTGKYHIVKWSKPEEKRCAGS